MKKLLYGIGLIILALVAAYLIYLQIKHNDAQTAARNQGSPTVKNGEPEAPIQFRDLGLAVEFPPKAQWLNGEPQTMANLAGKVVLLNFWTYSSMASLRTLPYLTKWQNQYRDQGLVIIGVHTPQYAFEKIPDNVQTAIGRYQPNYPVILDNDYKVWTAYGNQFWPAMYLVDRSGHVVYSSFGEGNYDTVDKAIRQLLSLSGGVGITELKNPTANTVTLMIGLKHRETLANPDKPTNREQVYTLPKKLKQNTVALEGVWKLENEKAVLTQGYGRVRLYGNAQTFRITADSIKPVTLHIKIDDDLEGEITVQPSRQYTLFTGNEPGDHTIELEIPQSGFAFSQFTLN